MAPQAEVLMAHVGQEIRRLREERNWSQAKLGVESGLGPSGISQIETGRRNPSAASLQKIAEALGVEVRDLFPLEQAPLPDFEDKRPTAEPLSPKVRKHAAWVRQAELEGDFKHLTLRMETLRNQATKHHEEGDLEAIWPLFMDARLLVAGAESLLSAGREEAQEIGGETQKERELRTRLEHRIEDLADVGEKVRDLWEELLFAKESAENEALRAGLKASEKLGELVPFTSRSKAG
jgi:transcriptional regulator with XRE-family HTH domain